MSIQDFTRLFQERKQSYVVISKLSQMIGLEVLYRHENGVVFPGIRKGTILKYRELNHPGYVKGLEFQVRDDQFKNHTTWVFCSSIKGATDDTIVFINPICEVE